MLKKHSLLRKLTLEISDDGKVAKGLVIFQEGAWDTEEKCWVGIPIETPGPLNNIDAEGKKRLNDVLGIAVTKALEDNAALRDSVKDHRAFIDGKVDEKAEWVDKWAKARDALAVKTTELATSERMLASSRERADNLLTLARAHGAKLDKIRRLTFGLLGK